MSEPTPKFGDVYRYKNDDQRVMIIGSTEDDDFYWAITIRAAPSDLHGGKPEWLVGGLYEWTVSGSLVRETP